MTKITASKVRKEFADTINKVAYGGKRIIVHRRGKDLAALIPMEDLDLLEAIEDRIDLEEARKALKEPGDTIPWEKVKADLGL
ncbi:MAG: type II toxin-antitoxin system Phd/YefM family antitoxin [Alphaproteobacteria bacterium]